PPDERDPHRPVSYQPYPQPDQDELDEEGDPADATRDARYGSGAYQNPDQRAFRYSLDQPEQRGPVLLPAPLHQQMVEKLPEHPHYGHAEKHQEAVLVLIAEWRAARQDRDDDQGYDAADHGEQENPGLYAASQGRNH